MLCYQRVIAIVRVAMPFGSLDCVLVPHRQSFYDHDAHVAGKVHGRRSDVGGHMRAHRLLWCLFRSSEPNFG